MYDERRTINETSALIVLPVTLRRCFLNQLYPPGLMRPFGASLVCNTHTYPAQSDSAILYVSVYNEPARPHPYLTCCRWRMYLGLSWQCPGLVAKAALVGLLISKEQGRQRLLAGVNAGGLGLLYRIILDSAQPEICKAIEVILQVRMLRVRLGMPPHGGNPNHEWKQTRRIEAFEESWGVQCTG